MNIKTQIVIVISFLALTSTNILAQKALEIVPKKIKYNRTNDDGTKIAKTFEVTYPTLKGDDAAINEIYETINYWRNFETPFEEHLGDYTWLTSMNYNVNYNKNGILDIQLIMEGIGAYPSTGFKNLVVDTKTGKKVKISDVFDEVESLYSKIELARQKEIAQAKSEAEKEGYDIDYELDQATDSEQKFEEFSISDKGITFLYDYGFPHVSRALQPPGRYFYTFAELKPFIKRDGLLGQFVR